VWLVRQLLAATPAISQPASTALHNQVGNFASVEQLKKQQRHVLMHTPSSHRVLHGLCADWCERQCLQR
jgi:hypothetical protein